MKQPVGNICGILVHIDPSQRTLARSSLEQLPGLEIHQETEEGQLIVTVEDTEKSAAFDCLVSIHATPGVLAAALTYHHFEPNGDAGSIDRE